MAIWKRAARTVPRHPYLDDRGIAVTTTGVEALRLSKTIALPGCRVPGGLLLVPMRNRGQELVNLQLVQPDGTKHLLPDAPVHDTWVRIGGSSLKHGNRTHYVCVGWKVGWAIHEATKCAVAVVFSARALGSAVAAIRDKYRC